MLGCFQSVAQMNRPALPHFFLRIGSDMIYITRSTRPGQSSDFLMSRVRGSSMPDQTLLWFRGVSLLSSKPTTLCGMFVPSDKSAGVGKAFHELKWERAFIAPGHNNKHPPWNGFNNSKGTAPTPELPRDQQSHLNPVAQPTHNYPPRPARRPALPEPTIRHQNPEPSPGPGPDRRQPSR
jgi:hypothetical protein